MLSRHELEPIQEQAESSSVSPVHVKGTSRLLDMNQSDIASLKSPFTTSAWFCATFKNEKLFEFHLKAKHNQTHQGVQRSFCKQNQWHKRTMAHVSLLQSQDVEVSVAGCPETACPWRLFARQRMGKLTDPRRKSSGDVKLLCAPRIGNKQYP